MKENGYAVWYKDNSDTVFVNPQQIKLDWKDKIKLILTEQHLSTRRTRKKLKQSLKNFFKKF